MARVSCQLVHHWLSRRLWSASVLVHFRSTVAQAFSIPPWPLLEPSYRTTPSSTHSRKAPCSSGPSRASQTFLLNLQSYSKTLRSSSATERVIQPSPPRLSPILTPLPISSHRSIPVPYHRVRASNTNKHGDCPLTHLAGLLFHPSPPIRWLRCSPHLPVHASCIRPPHIFDVRSHCCAAACLEPNLIGFFLPLPVCASSRVKTRSFLPLLDFSTS